MFIVYNIFYIFNRQYLNGHKILLLPFYACIWVAISIRSLNTKSGLTWQLSSSPGLYFPVITRPPSRPASWAPAGSVVTNSEKLILTQDTDNVISHVVTHHQDLVQGDILRKSWTGFNDIKIIFLGDFLCSFLPSLKNSLLGFPTTSAVLPEENSKPATKAPVPRANSEFFWKYLDLFTAISLPPFITIFMFKLCQTGVKTDFTKFKSLI